MKKIYEAAMILIGTVGWWGFVYPDMCFTEDVYEACEEDLEREQGEASEQEFLRNSFYGEAGRTENADSESPGLRSADSENADLTNMDSENTYLENTYSWNPGLKIGGIRIKSRIAEYVYQGRMRTEKR